MEIILLREKCLSNIFWAEAVACSAYLLNRSPTTSINMKVPQEAWSGTKLNVEHGVGHTFRIKEEYG